MAGSETRAKLIEYFKKNISKGYSADSLKWSLIKQGYPRSIVEIALEQAHKDLSKELSISKEKPVIKHEIYDDSDNLVNSNSRHKKSLWRRIFDFD